MASRAILLGIALAGGAVAALAWHKGLLVTPARSIVYAWLPLAVAGLAFILAMAARPVRVTAVASGLAAGLAVIGAELAVTALHQPAPAAASTQPQQPPGLPHACPQALLAGGHSPIRLDGAEVLPLGGAAHNLLGDGVVTDRHGFNNPDTVWDKPVDVLAVGDSFTFGIGVAPGRSFVDRLRERTSGVVNLGCSGNGPLAELGALVEYGPVVRPRIVLWGFFEGNDLSKDLPSEIQAPLLAGYLAGGGQDLAARHEAVDTALKHWVASQQRQPVATGTAAIDWRTALRLTQLRTMLGLHSAEFSPEILATWRRTIIRAVEVAKSWEGRVVLVYLPAEPRYATLMGARDADPYADWALDAARESGAEVVDLRPIFAAHPHPRSLFTGHYTEEGYALVAATIEAAIR